MRKLKCVLMFGLVLLLIAGCSKEEIQPDPLNATDDVSLKGAKAQKKECKGDHYVPFKASFELRADFMGFGAVGPWDFQEEWLASTPKIGAMYVDIEGSGHATHLGRTEFTIKQWWSKKYPFPGLVYPDSYGHGEVTFIAANGDLLYATYWGTADHQDDPPTEISSHGTFTGGTGRFEEVSGTFSWIGLFVREGETPNPNAVPAQDPYHLGSGTVTVSGKIKYNK